MTSVLVLAALVAAPTVVAAPLEVAGPFESFAEQALTEAWADGLQRRRFAAVTADACREARELDARFVLRGRVELAESDYRIVVQLVETKDCQTVAYEAPETCELCGLADAKALLDQQLGAIETRVEFLRAAPPVLHIDAQPAGAIVWIDGERVGPVPLQRRVKPGDREVRVVAPGHRPYVTTVTAVAGTEEHLALELEREPDAPPPPTAPHRGLLIAGAVLVAGGLASVGAGAGLLAIHGRPHRGRCSGADVDAFGNCRFVFDTRAGGAAAVAASGAAIVTGIVLLAVAAKRRRGARTTHGMLR